MTGQEAERMRIHGVGEAEIHSCGEDVRSAAKVFIGEVLNDSAGSAARTVREWSGSIVDLATTQGIAGLMELPAIGENLARAIYQLATTERLHDELGIQSLEELEIAAHDGRLARLHMSTKRILGIRDALAGRLGRVGRVGHRTALEHGPLPDVAEILDVDREYRADAAKGSLPRIVPRRFNPAHEAWLPVLHTHRGERHYTALFSNTARAQELGRTRDWVVLYFDGRGAERQCTVITAERVPLRGRRIVRGREDECLQHYQQREAHVSARAVAS